MIFSQEYQTNWNQKQKLLFRFLFSYLTIYIAFLLLGFALESPLRWFANNLLQWGGDFEIKNTGSGDRAYDYVKLGLNAVLAVITTLIWSVADRNRASYNQLYYWFRVFIRLTLFAAMLLYGLVKVFKGQFSDPNLARLLEPVGELSPMGLAWTFMGHSLAYNIFIGFAEVLGGLLVIFRKTVTLGALVIIGVMSNVAMMNFTYDIPVKLFSVHLVIFASVLALPDLKRLMKFFVKNEATARVEHYVPFTEPTLKKIISVVKILVTVVMVGGTILQCFIQVKLSGSQNKSELYGIWEAEVFTKGQDTIPPLITDSYRWRYLLLDQGETAFIKKMNDVLLPYEYETDSAAQKLTLYSNNGSRAHPFGYRLTDQGYLQISGVIHGDSLQVTLKKKPRSEFLLLNRGFHWVNEKPFKP